MGGGGAETIASAGIFEIDACGQDMSGYYEVRADGPQRKHFRLFCVLERQGATSGSAGPASFCSPGWLRISEPTSGQEKRSRRRGTNPHDHTLTFTAQQLTVLRNGGALTMNLTTSMGGPAMSVHTHTYSIECEP